MAKAILVQGLSGTGKSTSWRNMPSEESMIISPNGKQLPWGGSSGQYKPVNSTTGKGNVIVTNKLLEVPKWLQWINKAKHVKYVLIDDYTHFFNARIMSPDFLAQNNGNAAFQKWNVFGADVFNSVFGELPNLRDDLVIVISHHVSLNEMGKYTFKSSGKLLENTIDPVSYFTYVFHSRIIKTDAGMAYKFQTNDDTTYECKTPMGSFPDFLVDNDLYPIIKRINEYDQGL